MRTQANASPRRLRDLFRGADSSGVARPTVAAHSPVSTRNLLTVALRLAWILLAVLALAAAPSAALAAAPPAVLASSSNAAATRAYLNANYALVRAGRANLAAGNAALKSLVRQVTGECPLAAADSPENHDSEQVSNEVAGALTLVAYHPDVAAMDAFARAVQGLRWSNRVLTRTVRTYATQILGLAALAPPGVCGDVRAWAAGGFQALPASTVQFDTRYYAVDIEAEEVPLRLLKPYESAGEASLARRTKQLEAPLAEAEANAVSDYTQILDALKLNP